MDNQGHGTLAGRRLGSRLGAQGMEKVDRLGDAQPIRADEERSKHGTHLWGIINAVVLRVTNTSAESANAKIQ
jgi:hypothetical protein